MRTVRKAKRLDNRQERANRKEQCALLDLLRDNAPAAARKHRMDLALHLGCVSTLR